MSPEVLMAPSFFWHNFRRLPGDTQDPHLSLQQAGGGALQGFTGDLLGGF